MMELIEGLPHHVVACRGSGQVSDGDYKIVLIPAIEAALKEHDKIRCFYQLGPGFDGFTAHAMWDDAMIGMHHLLAFEKMAVTTDVDWIRHGVRVFAMPCPVNVFTLEEADAAKAWIAA